MRRSNLAGQCRFGVASLLAAGFVLTGCQSVAPTGLGALAAKQREQKIVKQAANDPFPSPKDVGLGETTKTF